MSSTSFFKSAISRSSKSKIKAYDFTEIDKNRAKAFLDKFGAPIEQLDQLVKAKTVTISKLMEIAPSGTVDPTPSLYNTTMYAMAGLLIVAFFSNLLMKPVHSKHFVENTHPGTLK